MSQPVDDRIKELPTLKRAALVLLWHELFGGPPPPQLRRELMLPILAYRLQEKEYGGLKPSIRTRLRKLAQLLAEDPTANVAPLPEIKPGTRLLRQWRGDTHEVSVVPSVRKGQQFVDELLHPAVVRFHDQVDSLVQALRWAEKRVNPGGRCYLV